MIRNLFLTLRRFKLASSLNIIGLSVAFVAFIVIMMQVRWEYTYGTTDRASDRIFRLDIASSITGKYNMNNFHKMNTEFAESSSEIIAYAKLRPQKFEISIPKTGEAQYFKDIPHTFIYNDIRMVFDIRMKQGMFESTMEPNKLLINESLATQLFGTADPIGQMIITRSDTCTVSGVYFDLPDNATLRNGIIHGQKEDRSFIAQELFVKLRNPAHTSTIITNFNAIDKNIGEFGVDNPKSTEVRLIPVGDIYFDTLATSNDFIPRGNQATTNILLAIAILVIIVAVINFINFYTALAPLRVKSLNTRLVFGARRSSLRRNILFEGTAISALAFILSLALLEIFTASPLCALIKISSTSLSDNLSIIGACGVIAVVIGFIAGLYPARYCTTFEPAVALKGSALGNTKGRMLRTSLIGIQFVISIALIICAMFVNLQHQTMADAPLGFDADNLLTVNTPDAKIAHQLKNELTSIPAVKSSAAYNGAFGHYSCDMSMDLAMASGDTIEFKAYFVDPDFLPTAGIPILSGRNFEQSAPDLWDVYSQAAQPDVIINSAAAKLFDAQVGTRLKTKNESSSLVIGITDNFVSKSIAMEQDPAAFIVTKTNAQVLIRIDAENTTATLAAIHKILRRLIPENTPTLSFYRQDVASLYTKERDMGTLITLFSTIAILISLVGVFGLVVFETQHRRKEIGVRKVFGSTITEILGMFNRRFVIIIAISFCVATPLAYYGVHQWLADFAYRTPIHWWVFAVGLAIVLLITATTVTIQSYRAATENPVNSLQNE